MYLFTRILIVKNVIEAILDVIASCDTFMYVEVGFVTEYDCIQYSIGDDCLLPASAHYLELRHRNRRIVTFRNFKSTRVNPPRHKD